MWNNRAARAPALGLFLLVACSRDLAPPEPPPRPETKPAATVAPVTKTSTTPPAPKKPSLWSRYGKLRKAAATIDLSSVAGKCPKLDAEKGAVVFRVSAQTIEQMENKELDYGKLDKIPQPAHVSALNTREFVAFLKTQTKKTQAQAFGMASKERKREYRLEQKRLRKLWKSTSRYALLSSTLEKTDPVITQSGVAQKTSGGKVVQKGSAGKFKPGSIKGWALVYDLDEEKVLCGTKVEAKNRARSLQWKSGQAARSIHRQLRDDLYGSFSVELQKAWEVMVPTLYDASRIKRR